MDINKVQTLVERVKKLMIEITELEHRVNILLSKLEHRRTLLEQIQELILSKSAERD